MSRFALIDPEGAFTGRTEEFDEEGAPTLAASKGKWVPVVDPGLDPASEVPEGLVVADGGHAVVFQVRAKTAEEVAAMRTAKLAEIKTEASRRILALYPSWKQMNMTARGVELSHIEDSRDLSEVELAEAAVLLSAWGTIKAIRARSDVLEAAVPHDASGIAAFDPASGWD